MGLLRWLTVLHVCVLSRAFLCSRKPIALSWSKTKVLLEALPTGEQLKSDSFMKQVGHANEIVPLLSDDSSQVDNEELVLLLTAQLSHSDGIRGFFVNYLSGEGESAADQSEVPTALVKALISIDNVDEVISLAAMNIIMPTAMISMHTDPTLQQSSAKTASRGSRVFEQLMQMEKYSQKTKATRDAILKAARENSAVETDNVRYWKGFFEKWGYKEQQIQDIIGVLTAME